MAIATAIGTAAHKDVTKNKDGSARKTPDRIPRSNVKSAVDRCMNILQRLTSDTERQSAIKAVTALVGL